MANDHRFTEEEKGEIVAKLREIAVATAEFWDVLRSIEAERGVEINYASELVDLLAGDCEIPAETANLDWTLVWRHSRPIRPSVALDESI